jgi:hypothetical protein
MYEAKRYMYDAVAVKPVLALTAQCACAARLTGRRYWRYTVTDRYI